MSAEKVDQIVSDEWLNEWIERTTQHSGGMQIKDTDVSNIWYLLVELREYRNKG